MQPDKALSLRGWAQWLTLAARQALHNYPITVKRLTLLAHSINAIFRVDAADGSRYVFRIHHQSGRTPEEILSELLWLAALHQEPSLAAPVPVPTSAGELMVRISAPGYGPGVLMGWIPGRFLDQRLQTSHLEQVGAYMARLHTSAYRFTPPSSFVRSRLDSLSHKPAGISEARARRPPDDAESEATALQLVAAACSPAEAEFVTRFLHRIRAAQERLGYSPDTFGLVHGDLHQRNYLFHQGQVRAIDFDDCGYGHYLYDLAVTLFDLRFRPGATKLRQGLFRGYRRVRTLDVEHEQELEFFIDLRELQMMLWMLGRRHHPSLQGVWEREVRETLSYFRRIVS